MASDFDLEGFELLLSERGEQFTFDGCPVTFRGLVRGVAEVKDPTVGGFEPGSEGAVACLRSECDAASFVPRPGQRITMRGQPWVVIRLETTPAIYRMRLGIAHPRGAR